jgi:hypothetical protein
MKLNKHISLLLQSFGVIMLISSSVFAQSGEEGRSKINEEIVIISDWIPPLTKSFKIDENPQIIDTVLPTPDYNYPMIPKVLNFDFKPELIKPAKMRVLEPLDKLYKGYARVGVGPITVMPLGELYLTNLRSKEKAMGLHVRHFSSQEDGRAPAFNGFSQNSAKLWYKHFSRHHTVETSMDYKRDGVYHFGLMQEDLDVDKSEIRKVFHYAEVNGRIKSHYKDSTAVNHDINLMYYYFGDQAAPEFSVYGDPFNMTENRVKIDGEFSKFFNKELFFLDAGIDLNNNVTGLNELPDSLVGFPGFDTQGVTNTIISLRPRISSSGDFWKVKAGIALFSQIQDVAKFHFYFDSEAQFSLFDDIFMPYAGITGGIRRNSARDFFMQNPFISANPGMLMNTNEKFNLYGGIRGTISSKISFNTKAAVMRLENAALFTNRIFLGSANRFEVVYDDMEVFHISGEINYQQNERLMIYLKGEYNSYGTTTQTEAWHLPELTGTLTAKYNLANKFILKSEIYAMGVRYAQGYSTDENITAVFTQELQPFADLNLGLDYRYTGRTSFFVNLNNILNNRYQRWNGFQNFGFNAMAGFTYSF